MVTEGRGGGLADRKGGGLQVEKRSIRGREKENRRRAKEGRRRLLAVVVAPAIASVKVDGRVRVVR